MMGRILEEEEDKMLSKNRTLNAMCGISSIYVLGHVMYIWRKLIFQFLEFTRVNYCRIDLHTISLRYLHRLSTSSHFMYN
jgi:hypothetical protein